MVEPKKETFFECRNKCLLEETEKKNHELKTFMNLLAGKIFMNLLGTS
jgi:hypothetical protein